MRAWVLPVAPCVALVFLSGCQALAAVGPVIAVCATAELTDGFRFSRRSARTGADRDNRATSEQPREQWGLRVKRLIQLYDECEYLRCLQETDVIIKNSTASDRDLAIAYLYQGAILYLRGARREAAASFRRSYQLYPSCLIDRRRFKPAVVTCYEHAIHDKKP